MRYKVVPPVRSIDFLREASDCLPLVPGTVEDCCARIRDGTDLAARDEAREYLTFLQALGLAREAQDGYYRPRDPPGEEDLATAFVEGVFGAREVREALAEPRTAGEVFGAAVEPLVPAWERDREQDWHSEWQIRTERILGWGVELGVFGRLDEERYRSL